MVLALMLRWAAGWIKLFHLKVTIIFQQRVGY